MKFIVYAGKLNTTELAIQTIMEMSEIRKNMPSVKHIYQRVSDITYISLDELMLKYSGTVYLPSLVRDNNNPLPATAGKLDIQTIVKYCKIVDIPDIEVIDLEESTDQLKDMNVLHTKDLVEEINLYNGLDKNYYITSLGSIKYNKFIICTKNYRSAILINNSNVKAIGDFKNSNIQLWDSLYEFCELLSIKRMLLIIDNEIYPYHNKYLTRLSEAYEYIIENGEYLPTYVENLHQLYLPEGTKFVNGRVYKCKSCKKWMILTVNEYRTLLSKNWFNPNKCRTCRDRSIKNTSTVDEVAVTIS